MVFSKQVKVRRHAGRPRLPGLRVAKQSRPAPGHAWAALCNRMPAVGASSRRPAAVRRSFDRGIRDGR